MEDENDKLPSTCTSKYWIGARNNTANLVPPTEKCGKWMVFHKQSEIDAIWFKIAKATEEGQLGFAAKVSTMKEKPENKSEDKGVICIYTYDWTDEVDVMRVRKVLRDLGFVAPIPYKSDADTLAGVYRATGHRRISKYYC